MKPFRRKALIIASQRRRAIFNAQLGSLGESMAKHISWISESDGFVRQILDPEGCRQRRIARLKAWAKEAKAKPRTLRYHITLQRVEAISNEACEGAIESVTELMEFIRKKTSEAMGLPSHMITNAQVLTAKPRRLEQGWMLAEPKASIVIAKGPHPVEDDDEEMKT
jgi:hypothetical protein